MRRSARAALLVTELQIAALALYAAGSLALRGLDVLTGWSALVTLVSAALLVYQRLLLRGLFRGEAADGDDGRLNAWRGLYIVVLISGLLMLALYLLVLLAPQDVPNPEALALLLVATGASLYATYGTFRAMNRLFVAPEDASARVSAREWLGRNALATGVVAVMNLVPIRGVPDTTPLTLTLAYALVSLLDVAWPLLIRAALRGRS
ncbi:hypothetical protein [Deinococcus pimensis]|uniref:hypothetical protein n=1 Tax=Deinococcus pimensis TaxID=309888 RepID=UPI000482F111|nr:hypothetical protein [Deinococcus pimensis]